MPELSAPPHTAAPAASAAASQPAARPAPAPAAAPAARRRWGLWAAFAAVAALLALLAVGLTRDPRELPSALIGQPWPAHPLPLLQAPAQRMGPQQWRGKARVVNLWASWCAACQHEHPALMRLAAQLQASGHADQLIGLNYKDQRAAALVWLARLGNPFHATLQDGDGRLGIDLGVYGAPETFVIDTQGVIRAKYVGALTDELIQRHILPLLEQGR